MELRDYQLEAIGKMKNGCILNGGVGSGKSLTSLSIIIFKMEEVLNFYRVKIIFQCRIRRKIFILLQPQENETPLNGKENYHTFYYLRMMT